jgi:hypothetical protein
VTVSIALSPFDPSYIIDQLDLGALLFVRLKAGYVKK